MEKKKEGKVHAGELRGIALGINRGQHRGRDRHRWTPGRGGEAKMWPNSSRPAVSRFAVINCSRRRHRSEDDDDDDDDEGPKQWRRC